jgi:hypothetical protein
VIVSCEFDELLYCKFNNGDIRMLKVVTVFDSKVEAYLPPMYFKARGEALRSITETCNDSQSMFFKHPADYFFYELGEFDDSKGVFTLTEPKILGCALDFKSVG